MNFQEQAIKDNRLMLILKLTSVRHVVARTDRGDLSLGLEKGESGADYRFYLDTVPVGTEENQKLLALFGR